MRGRQRHVEEEGLLRALRRNVFERLPRDALETLPVFEIGSLRAAALQQQALAVGRGPVGLRCHPVILYIYIRWHVERSRDTEEIVEAAGHGTVPDRAGEVHLAVAHGPVPAQMPFADAGRRIAQLRKEGGDRAAAGSDQRRGVAVRDAAFEGRAEGVAPRQDAVARRRAHRRARMGVSEGHSVAAEGVDGRGPYPGFFIQGRDVAVAHVVSQNKDDVGLCGAGQRRGQCGRRSEHRAFVEFHHLCRN